MKAYGYNAFWLYGAANSWVRDVRQPARGQGAAAALPRCMLAHQHAVEWPQRAQSAMPQNYRALFALLLCISLTVPPTKLLPQVEIINADTGAEAQNSDFITIRGITFNITATR